MADSKVSQLASIDNSTITTADVLPIVNGGSTKNITYLNLMSPKDTTFLLVNGADLTKKVAFQLSGITTGNTRTLTIPDASTTLVGTDATQTLTNKTISTGSKINVSGSDGTGAIYYRDASGNFTNLGIGSTNQILSVTAGLPSWIANPAISAASYTVQGAVQFLTDAATSGITVTAGVANVNTGTGANQIVKLNASSQLPAISGVLLTNVPGATNANGTTTKNASDASTTQNIAHGLGVIPKSISIFGTLWSLNLSINGNSAQKATLFANTFYNGTTQSSQSVYINTTATDLIQSQTFTLNAAGDSGTQTGVVTFDATNIIITWTKTNSPTGTYNLLWRANG